MLAPRTLCTVIQSLLCKNKTLTGPSLVPRRTVCHYLFLVRGGREPLSPICKENLSLANDRDTSHSLSSHAHSSRRSKQPTTFARRVQIDNARRQPDANNRLTDMSTKVEADMVA